GVQIAGSASTSNFVEANIIGLTLVGAAAGNHRNGVFLSGASFNVIGASAAIGHNVIDANTGAGVSISNCTNNIVEGNFIGTTATSTSGLGNSGGGILLDNAASNTIGGTAAA